VDISFCISLSGFVGLFTLFITRFVEMHHELVAGLLLEIVPIWCGVGNEEPGDNDF
jgi:hypothetical protein